MASKRSRPSDDSKGRLDELLTLPIRSLADNDDSSNMWGASCPSSSGITEDEAPSPSVFKRPRTSEMSRPLLFRDPSSVPSSPPQSITCSIGGDEIDMLRRKDEDVADMALFLSQTVAETASCNSFSELITLLEKLGTPRVLLALKRTGALVPFVRHLCRASFRAAAEVRLILLLLQHFIILDDSGFMFQDRVVVLLANSLRWKEAVQISPSEHRVTHHWSYRRTRSSPTRSPNSSRGACADEERLVRRVEALCDESPVPPSISSVAACTSVALRALLSLVFAFNRRTRAAAAQELCIPIALARCGGLTTLGELLHDEGSCGDALALLEVLTVAEELRSQPDALLPLVPLLVTQLGYRVVPLTALKVLTNITNILPSCLSATASVDAFAKFFGSVLASPPSTFVSEEMEAYALCCAVNVLKFESTLPHDEQAPLSTVLFRLDGLFASVASKMVASYREEQTEELVRSGYYALLLGALSLVRVDTEDGRATLRVPIMAAVAMASRDTPLGRTTEHQPLRLVVAIVQEFLLFQSSSGTLTKQSLEDMTTLVEQIMCENNISPSLADELSATIGTADKDFTAEDDDVLLGELL